MRNPEMPLKKQNIEMKNISNQREIKVENGVKHLNNFMVFRHLKRFMECCGLNYLKIVFKKSQLSRILCVKSEIYPYLVPPRTSDSKMLFTHYY